MLERRTWLFDEATFTFVVLDPRPLAGETTGELLVVVTVDPDNGVSDTLEGDLGNDLLLGGGGSDTIWGNSGNDLVFGDFALVIVHRVRHREWRAAGSTSRCCRSTSRSTTTPSRGRRSSPAPTTTGATTSSTATPVRTSSSAAPGPTGSPAAPATTTSIGGNTGDAFLGLPDTGGAGGYNAGVDYSAGLIYGDDWDATGGIDGPHSACNTDADCTYGDFLDGGSGNDVIAGDNATILRTGSTAGPRFRVLTGASSSTPRPGAANIAGTE